MSERVTHRVRDHYGAEHAVTVREDAAYREVIVVEHDKREVERWEAQGWEILNMLPWGFGIWLFVMTPEHPAAP